MRLTSYANENPEHSFLNAGMPLGGDAADVEPHA